MSFANKGKDSSDTTKLRKEYEKKAQEFRDTKDPASKAKLKDDKAKAFERVRDQIAAERRDDLGPVHKVLISQGKLRTKEQQAALMAQAKAMAGAR